MSAREALDDTYLRLLAPEEVPVREDEEELDPATEEEEPSEALLGDAPSSSSGDPVRKYLTEIGSYPLLTLEEEVELARKIQEGQEAARQLGELLGLDPDLVLAVARARVNDRHETPAYARFEALSSKTVEEVEARARSSKEGKRLYLLVREGEEARRRMVLANLRLVVSVAKRFARRAQGVHFIDLIQEGNFGLMRATALFNWRTRNKFSTYATWWIKQAVGRALHDQNRMIRLPVHVNETLAKVQKAQADLAQRLGREPTKEEIAKELGEGWTEEKVAELLSLPAAVTSLDAPVMADHDEDESDPLLNFLKDERFSPEDFAEKRALSEHLEKAIAELSEREAKVVRLRFGLDGHPPTTLEMAGKELGITRERVRQLEQKALRKLKRLLLKEGLQNFWE